MSDDDRPRGQPPTARISLELPKSLLGNVDDVWRNRHYISRGEFMRAAIRAGVRSPAWNQTGRDDGESVEALIAQGLSPVQAVDYYYVKRQGYSQKQWAEIRDTSPQSISQNVLNAEEHLTRDQ